MDYSIGDIIVLKYPGSNGAWSHEMQEYVGRKAIIRTVGTWPAYGPYVKVDIDEERFVWFEDMFKIKKTLSYEIY